MVHIEKQKRQQGKQEQEQEAKERDFLTEESKDSSSVSEI